MTSFRVPRRERGFSLIELLVTMVIAAILLAVAVPSFRAFLANSRSKAASSELISAFLLARSEATKRNGTVSVVPVSSSAWASGWSVKNGATVLNAQEAFESITVTPMNASCTSDEATTTVDFASTGRPGASTCFKITGTNATARCVKVDLTGIPSAGTC